MSEIADCADPMPQQMAGPIDMPADTEGIVMGDFARPHDLRSIVVIPGILQLEWADIEYSSHCRFTLQIGDDNIGGIGKISLHYMRKGVIGAASCLVRRERHSKLGIHYGELGADHIDVNRFLLAGCLVCNHTAVATLASGTRKGQYRPGGQGLFAGCLFLKEVPDVSSVQHAKCDSLPGIDNASAADVQHKIDPFPAANLNPFLNERKPRIGHNTAELGILHPRVFE